MILNQGQNDSLGQQPFDPGKLFRNPIAQESASYDHGAKKILTPVSHPFSDRDAARTAFPTGAVADEALASGRHN